MVPPEAESIGVALKSSFTASIVVGVKQKSISPIASPWNDGEQIPHSSHRIVMEDIPSASVILTFALPGGLPNPPFASKIASVVVKLTSKVSVGSFWLTVGNALPEVPVVAEIVILSPPEPKLPLMCPTSKFTWLTGVENV